jgi:hypothetical protein
LDYPFLGGSKYRNLAFQVGGVSKIETIKYVHASVGLRPENGCADDAEQKLKTTDPTSHQRERSPSLNP